MFSKEPCHCAPPSNVFVDDLFFCMFRRLFALFAVSFRLCLRHWVLPPIPFLIAIEVMVNMSLLHSLSSKHESDTGTSNDPPCLTFDVNSGLQDSLHDSASGQSEQLSLFVKKCSPLSMITILWPRLSCRKSVKTSIVINSSNVALSILHNMHTVHSLSCVCRIRGRYSPYRIQIKNTLFSFSQSFQVHVFVFLLSYCVKTIGMAENYFGI